MKVVGSCSQCKKQFKIDAVHAGKTLPCPKCGGSVTVPQPPADSPPDRAAPTRRAGPPPLLQRDDPLPGSASDATFPDLGSFLPDPPTHSSAPRTTARLADDIASSPATPDDNAPAPPSRRPGRKNAPALWLAGGSALLLVVVGVAATVVILKQNTKTNPAIAQKQDDVKEPDKDADRPEPEPMKPASDSPKAAEPKEEIATGGATLILDIPPDDREDIAVTLDGQKLKVPVLGNIAYPLPAGKHQLVLQRHGFLRIEQSLSLKTGQQEHIKPDWKPTAPPDANPSAVTTASAPPVAAAPPLAGYEGWLFDPEEAQKKAAAEGKDVLMAFMITDGGSERARLLQYEVFFQAEFREKVLPKFVPVLLDFPEKPANRDKQDEATKVRNRNWKARLFVVDPPVIMLMDPKGRVFGHIEVEQTDSKQFLSKLSELQAGRAERDRRFTEVDKATGADQLAAAVKALEWVDQNSLLLQYRSALQEWLALGIKFDPRNELGQYEAVFEADWLVRVVTTADSNDLLKLVAELDQWKVKVKIKEPDRGARMHLMAANVMEVLKRLDDAARYAVAGLEYHPTDKNLIGKLARFDSLVGILGTGSSFVVAEGGYLLTNHHVVAGQGTRLLVRLPNVEAPAPAKVVADDEAHDIALIQVDTAEAKRLKPLPIAEEALSRGAAVAALGFPLGDAVSTKVTLTTGVVSTLPDKANNNMLLLDLRVNPGNSGGPLCDARGAVVGMVTAKSGSGMGLDSYGMAIPAADLVAFLKKNVPNYAPVAAPAASKPWDEVDKLVSSSVLMVIKKK